MLIPCLVKVLYAAVKILEKIPNINPKLDSVPVKFSWPTPRPNPKITIRQQQITFHEVFFFKTILDSITVNIRVIDLAT